jgi:hypothetical protein
LLALLVLLAIQLPNLWYDPTVPNVFRITRIDYYPAADGVNYVGFVVIANTDAQDYRNRYLMVKTYINGNPTDCYVPTLNNDLFCSQAVHSGVAHLWGVGTWGDMKSPLSVWPADSEISIEYAKGKLRPGDRVTLEFFNTKTNQLISQDTYPHENENQEKMMRLYFSRQGA